MRRSASTKKARAGTIEKAAKAKMAGRVRRISRFEGGDAQRQRVMLLLVEDEERQ